MTIIAANSSILRRPTVARFEKVAARTLLGDTPANWPTELMGNLYRQHPFLSNYMVDLQIKAQDEAAGYLYGVFIIKPPLAPAVAAPQQSYGAPPAAPTVAIRIPVVATSRRVFPFDIFITQGGKFLPLTETRVTSAMYTVSPYRPVNPATASNPMMVGPGFNADMPNAGFGKIGSLHPDLAVRRLGSRSLLHSVVKLASLEQRDELVRRVAEDSELRAAMRVAPAFADAISVVVEAPTRTKLASVPQVIPLVSDATVAIALIKTADDFRAVAAVATDRPGVFEIESAQVGRQLAGSFPLSVRQEAMETGIAVMSDESAELPEISSLSDGNLRKVASATEHLRLYVGRQHGGEVGQMAVMTKVAHLDGRPANYTLVVGDAGMSLQDAPAGVPVGLSISLEKLAFSEPNGEGFFIMGDTASEPVRVVNRMSSPDGDVLQVQDWVGRNVKLKLASVRSPVAYADSAYLFPQDARFVSMNAAKHEYVTDPKVLTKLAAQQETREAVTVRANAAGGIDAFRAGQKIASYETAAESLVYLAALGDSPKGAKSKFAALCCGKATTKVLQPKARTVKRAVITKLASATCTEEEAAAIRIDLVKEASSLSAPDTVDAVLSLSFVTPETVTAYLEHLPVLEDAISSLAEMTLGARLGVPEIPESASSSALSGMDKAVQGLKMLQIRLSLPTAEAE